MMMVFFKLFQVLQIIHSAVLATETGKKAHKMGSTLALKPRADISRNRGRGYQWPHEKGLMASKNFTKKSITNM